MAKTVRVEHPVATRMNNERSVEVSGGKQHYKSLADHGIEVGVHAERWRDNRIH